MKKLELLAPAGGQKALETAVETGADAVYMGASEFNARYSAENFSLEQLKSAIDYCHLRGVKVYITLNTLVNDREFKSLEQYIRFINENGADAVIVQDLGVVSLIKKVAPELPLHASTQMTVTDSDGVKLLEGLGFKRVVLARELSKEQISNICAKTEIETEVFVHGALCVCYSGQCLMSSFIGGRSGNRGKCAQPCRLAYKSDGKSGFLLSPKDLCLIDHIKELEDIGVSSLKIEGRMKGNEYVGTVTSVYRKYIDSNRPVLEEDRQRLQKIFYRGGYTDGYFTGGKTGMLCHDKPDNPYLNQEKYRHITFDRTRKTDIFCEISEGKPIYLKLSCNGVSAEYKGGISAEIAENKPLTEDMVSKQLSKLGGTVFTPGHTDVRIYGEPALPVSEINNARRQCVPLLEQAIINSFKRESISHSLTLDKGKLNNDFQLSVQAYTLQQLNALRKTRCKNIYAPYDLAMDSEIAVLPRISPDGLKQQLLDLGIKQALARNIGQVQLLRQLGIEIYIDFTMNVFNSYSAGVYEELGAKRITLSSELMLSQIRDIGVSVPKEAVIYGYIPLMYTENCIIKNSGKCHSGAGGKITDRTGAQFDIICCDRCRNEILNSKPVMMQDKLEELKGAVNYGRLMFTTESPARCVEIYNAYIKREKISGDFTRGKYYNATY